MIKKVEELSMNAWPSFQTRLYDGWVLRFSDGYTKRANSVNPIYGSSVPANVKIDFCEEEYKLHGLPAVFKLTGESIPADLDDILAGRGYARLDETAVRLMDLAGYRSNAHEGVVLEGVLDRKWLEGFYCCSGITDINIISAANKILENISGKVIFASKQVGGETVGCGYGAIERGFVGLFDIVVKREHRRNGFGREIVESILHKAAGLGASYAYLQVVAGNAPAERLYDSLGFREAYRYWYRVQPGL